MATPKKKKSDKPISQHEPTPEELDEALKIDDIGPNALLKGLMSQQLPD